MGRPNNRLEHVTGQAKREKLQAADSTRKPSKARVIEVLKALLPEIDWVLRRMEGDGGWLRLPPTVVETLTRLKITNYAEHYVDEKRMFAVFVVAMTGEGPQGKEFLEELGRTYQEDPDAFLAEAVGVVNEADAGIERLLALSEAQKAHARAEFEQLPEQERRAKVRELQLWVSFGILVFFQTLALMVHGRKMTALVASAIEGDDDAYAKAVQIDRSVLVSIPYFRDRLLRAHLEGHGGFCERLGYRIANPVIKGKIRYRTLWIVFAFLEMFGMLDGSLKHREILDICEAVGVGGKKFRIEDVGYLSKRLAEYRRFQRNGGRSTH